MTSDDYFEAEQSFPTLLRAVEPYLKQDELEELVAVLVNPLVAKKDLGSIMKAFTWDDTVQGYSYWADVHQKVTQRMSDPLWSQPQALVDAAPTQSIMDITRGMFQ